MNPMRKMLAIGILALGFAPPAAGQSVTDPESMGCVAALALGCRAVAPVPQSGVGDRRESCAKYVELS